MKTYTTQSGDTFDSVAQKLGIKNGNILKTYHNLYSDKPEDLMHGNMQAGKQILIPEGSQYLMEENNDSSENESQYSNEEIDLGVDTISETENDSSNSTTSDQEKEEKKEEKKEDSRSSEHDGKYFVIQKGMCQCNQGFKFPKFKVTSHQKHYWNDEQGKADYLAVTEDDLTFDPPAMPFGNCKLKPTSGGYLPCAYAPAGKWTKAYEKVKVMGKSCLTEISELMCATGGKITILKHGQQSELGKSNVMNANSREQQVYNPVVNFDEFKDDVLGKDFSDDYQ